MKALNYAIAAAAGALVGAAIGVLAAPKSGNETRNAIKDFIKSKCPLMKESKLDALVEKIKEDIAEAE